MRANEPGARVVIASLPTRAWYQYESPASAARPRRRRHEVRATSSSPSSSKSSWQPSSSPAC